MLILCGAMAAPLVGSGLPEIEVTPTTLDLGALTIGDTAAGAVTVSNLGNDPLTIHDVRLLPGSGSGCFRPISRKNPTWKR